jgi:tetratricopeptide (TPR) repeat protein
VNRFRALKLPLASAALVAVLACAILTRQQVPAWQNSLSLQRHSLAVGEDNATARYLLAVSLQAAGRPESEVIAEYQRSVALQPDYVNALTQIAMIALRHQQFAEAQALIEQTVRLEPANLSLKSNLAALESLQDRPAEATAHLGDIVRLNPSFTAGRHALAQYFLKQNRLDDARRELETVLQESRWDFLAWFELGSVHARQQRPDEALRCTGRALWINPAFTPAIRKWLVLDRLERLRRAQR